MNNLFSTETGVVLSTKRNVCYVKIEKTSKCEGCKICDFGKNNFITVPCYNSVNANVGDKVVITSKQLKTYSSSLFLYLIPIILIVVAALCFYRYGDKVVLIACFIGLILGLCIAFIFDKIVRKKIMPKVIRII